MAPLITEGPNAEQIRYWNEVSGPRWVAGEALLDAQIAPLGRVALDRAGVVAGERVLDIGCGCGQTSLALAELVGPEGAVTGIDLSAVMLARAQQRASDAGLSNVSFEQADAQTAALGDARVDLVFSRFGVMFFADPVAAFRNLRRATARGGRLAFVCWQRIALNPWMAIPLDVVARFVELPGPAEPGTPGPFAFADAARVTGILEDAGYQAVTLEPVQRPIAIGGDGGLAAAVAFVLQIGPAGAALRDADAATRERAAVAVRTALEPFVTDGVVQMDSATWIATATSGG